MCALAGILAWGVLNLAYIRMYAAMKAQGVSRDHDIPWKSALQPYGAWFGMIVSFVIVIFSGFTVFIKSNWDTASFFANYISLIIFLVPYVFFKFYWKTKVCLFLPVSSLCLFPLPSSLLPLPSSLFPPSISSLCLSLYRIAH